MENTDIQELLDKLIAGLNKDKVIFEKFNKIRPTIKGGLSDIGNTIGFIIGVAIEEHKDKENFNVEEFLKGFQHGISLTDGTH